MVLHCHRERRYMVETQPHLCHWVPIALPFSDWVVKPAPFGHPLFSLFPFLSPLVFKGYDAMSRFSCPPSFVMGAKAARSKFPQLSRESKGIKFVQVTIRASTRKNGLFRRGRGRSSTRRCTTTRARTWPSR